MGSILRKLFLCAIGVAFAVSTAWSHGENQAGPHGGVIRMPGAFHVELTQPNRDTLAIYVLDLEFKDPTVAGAPPAVKWRSKSKTDVALSCQPKENHFQCRLPKGTRFKEGDTIVVLAKRGELTGGEAIFPFPFRPENSGKNRQEHPDHYNYEGHHGH